MIDELRALAIFVKVVECASFRAAALALRLSPSVVSHHVASLERRLGSALLYRSTRRLSLTDEGAKLFVAAQEMMAAAERGLDIIAGKSAEPSGRFKMTVPAFFSRSPLMNRIADFARSYPKIHLDIGFSDSSEDLVREGIDLAIRVGDLKDSGLKSKRLYDMPRKLVAAPSLVARYKKPRTPDDLIPWEWIGLKMRNDSKTFVHKKGSTASINILPRLVVDSVDAASQLAIAGAGLATPPTFLVEAAIAEGILVELIPSYQVPSLPVFALWPANPGKAHLTERFIHFHQGLSK
ncbi:LysR family transcriptional regulator [Undibacterium cyanobacteriorum]|uniref:LysR family transcriptional regulator n=1 Tax=Undibacterium cyanobacteriorum TaxID=3073561 RepID=A0ABY9RJR3_9BURK|nr:LysR family transcriptional regulator [Undibacterium sp. 20NA77.5]WMW80904.1 LysR family transcriptional regulator [Undibacterium sp. 20NA77.5]